MPGSPCHAFGAAGATFVGTVIDAKTIQPKQNEKGEVEWGRRIFRFTISQPFSGVAGTEVEVSKERDITLPPRRAECVVKGVVRWEDGGPVTNADVGFRDVTYHDPGIDNGLRADARGRFEIKCYQGQTFLVRASSGRRFVGDYRRDGPMERASAVRVTADAPTAEVTLVITKLR